VAAGSLHAIARRLLANVDANTSGSGRFVVRREPCRERPARSQRVGAEGATAPETLRHPKRYGVAPLESEYIALMATPARCAPPKEVGRFGG
jgi:hypothetical protein